MVENLELKAVYRKYLNQNLHPQSGEEQWLVPLVLHEDYLKGKISEDNLINALKELINESSNGRARRLSFILLLETISKPKRCFSLAEFTAISDGDYLMKRIAVKYLLSHFYLKALEIISHLYNHMSAGDVPSRDNKFYFNLILDDARAMSQQKGQVLDILMIDALRERFLEFVESKRKK